MSPEEDAERGAEVCRCPDCGTSRVVLRKTRDHIDRLSRSPSSLLAKVRGGKLYHCIFCRLQFYSTLPLEVRDKAGEDSEEPSSAA